MKSPSWIKEWYKKQEQYDRLVATYKNNEMTKPIQKKVKNGKTTTR